MKIDSAEEFIKKLISEFSIELPEGKMFTEYDCQGRIFNFFRGHSDFKWKFLPNCARKNKKREYISLAESNFNINIKELARWQHYQQELDKTTRLLDFTSSLYVGLYFACCDNFDQDGELFILKYAPDYYQCERIKAATFYLKCNEDREYTNKSIYDVYKNSMLEEGLTPKDYSDMLREINDTFSYGRLIVFDKEFCEKTNNFRLLIQKGALFFCPSDIRFEKEKTFKKISEKEFVELLHDISSYYFSTKEMEYYINVHQIREPKWLFFKDEKQTSKLIERQRIPKELKQDILEYLKAAEGITKESLGL